MPLHASATARCAASRVAYGPGGYLTWPSSSVSADLQSHGTPSSSSGFRQSFCQRVQVPSPVFRLNADEPGCAAAKFELPGLVSEQLVARDRVSTAVAFECSVGSQTAMRVHSGTTIQIHTHTHANRTVLRTKHGAGRGNTEQGGHLPACFAVARMLCAGRTHASIPFGAQSSLDLPVHPRKTAVNLGSRKCCGNCFDWQTGNDAALRVANLAHRW